MREEFRVAGVARIVQRQKSLLHEEGVEVYGAIEAGETVIGNDHQLGAAAGLLHRLPDGLVDCFVDLEQVGLETPPEHVRVLVHAGKIVKEQAALEAVQLVAEDPKAVGENLPALTEELVLGENPRAVGGGVFRDALRVIRPDGAGELPRVRFGRRYGRARGPAGRY